jgi:1-acyl-sn-glycerol-3-phosphate acyltransferase
MPLRRNHARRRLLPGLVRSGMNYLRSAIFLLLATATVIPWSFVVLSAYVTPVATRYRLCTMWTRFAIVLARRVCGITWRVEGWENLPDEPAILLPKHQSTWETLWLPSFIPRPLTFVYKRELHYLPFFGWAMASLGMINIDRSRGQDAFEQVVRQGTDHLRDGWWIVIFPEGTRTPPGSTRRYKSGGTRLSVRTGTPVVPIAVNSGEVWPRRMFLKVPGEITVSIGRPIAPEGRTADQVMALVESWIETEMRRLAPHRYHAPYIPSSRADAKHRDGSGNAM